MAAANNPRGDVRVAVEEPVLADVDEDDDDMVREVVTVDVTELERDAVDVCELQIPKSACIERENEGIAV